MMEEFILPSLGVELGPGWVLIMDNAPSHKAKKAHAGDDHVARARPGAVQLSRQERQPRHAKRDAHTHTETDTFHQSAGIGRVISQPACSHDLNPLDTWASNAIKREIFAVRRRISLKAEGMRTWDVVCSWQLVAATGDAFEHISTDSPEL